MGFFDKLKDSLKKTRQAVSDGLGDIFIGEGDIDDDFYDRLEETLIRSDMGAEASERIIDKLRDQVPEEHLRRRKDAKKFLINDIKEEMKTAPDAFDFEKQRSVVFVTGVNGVGKTTFCGKLAYKLTQEGKKVLLAAADTYRAGAAEQLSLWADRAGCNIIQGNAGADPSSVIYDAASSANARDIDVLICDTAGRLENRRNLMEELKKMDRVIDRIMPDVKRENLLVLDAVTGQNAVSQAKGFSEVTDLTGIVLTKLDGTPKGGIAVAIESELGIPVKYIGIGEQKEDLERFDADAFVDAMFSDDTSEEASEDDW
ncbi:MAG: signal recognition particle-docking protein FtsY [Lachnospiraceae bacterium]|nr:signal recognition particle-docking protein FtsY [Lachnospiraceae bacterium]